MKLSEAIRRLEAAQRVLGDNANVSTIRLIEIVWINQPRLVEEHKARARMVLDAARAKRQAGFPRTAAFFRDVWPVALDALKKERKVAK
jgi:hypothetical protein